MLEKNDYFQTLNLFNSCLSNPLGPMKSFTTHSQGFGSEFLLMNAAIGNNHNWTLNTLSTLA